MLSVGEQFKAEYIGNNTIRMYDGKLMNNGAAAGIPAGEYIDFLLPNTSAGMKRNDLIVFQYSKDPSTLVESGSFVVIQGTETSGTPTDPTLTEGDLLAGDTFDQMALWRVKVEGTTINAPECVFNVRGCAPSGFGLGDVSRLVTDCNEAISNGWYYYGASASNIPQYIPYGCLLVVNRSGLEVERVQIAFSTDNGVKAQRRYKNASDGWSEWEYENPPMKSNVEYRTCEKWLDKPIYVKAVNIGTLPNASTKKTAHNISNLDETLDAQWRASSASLNVKSIIVTATEIEITTTSNLSGITNAHIFLKYTKTTD